MYHLRLIRPRIFPFSLVDVVSKSKNVSQFRRCNLLSAIGAFKCKAFNYCTLPEIKCPTYAETILESYSNSDSIPWEKIRKDILKEDIDGAKTESGVNSVILTACRYSKQVETCVSYFKFLSRNNIKLTLVEFYEILLMFSLAPEEKILAHKDVLLEIFDIIKGDMKLHHLIFSRCAKVYFCFEECWRIMVDMFDENIHRNNSGLMYLAIGAFNHGTTQQGWKIISVNHNFFNTQFVDYYMNYCLKMAQKKKFTPSLLTDLVQFCQENVIIIPAPNLVDKLKDLVNVLNSNKSTSFFWSVHSSDVSEKGICSCCKRKIGSVRISKDEFNQLKSHFLKDVIISKNIHMKTSEAELNRFLKFLDKSTQYRIVVDGLNLHHLLKDKFKVVKLFEYFKIRNMNILLIVRKHFVNNKNYDFIKSYCQIFCTENLSDDDVFTIYATLHGGMGTYFLTRDLLRCHTTLITNPELRRVFVKWQLSHQYTMDQQSFKIIHPKVHSSLSQFTNHSVKTEENYSWHLSTKQTLQKRLSSSNMTSWICLKAKSK